MTLVFHRLDEQQTMRRRLDRFLRTVGASRTCRQAAGLIASELFSNAIEHGEAGEVRVVAEVADQITLAISHPSATAEPVRLGRVMPPPMAARGRGLAIVDRLACHVETEVVGGWHRTEAVLALRD